MQKRTLKVALLAALTVILVLSFSGVALADQTWSDLPDTVTAKYGITDNEVASISDGFPGGVWKPFQNITRAQFTKMAVMAFGVPLVDPATATFSDVKKGSIYYKYVEGAKAAGMVNGTSATTFSPNANITREQAVAIVSRYVAKVNGYNLATMYTAAEITALLGQFGDAASVGSALRAEMAFAIDMGITVGDAYGNLNPLGNLLRIQAAAFLIRARGLKPGPAIPAKIALVTADKGENLIGQPHKVTFKVTQADGSPAPSILVDFDAMFASPFYVGNVSPQAAMTDKNGEVTVNLISAEPGTQRVSAAVAGLAAIYTTKYWLVLDEVYTVTTFPYSGYKWDRRMDGPFTADYYFKKHSKYPTYDAQNNVGNAHQWCVRVIVFGPGPRSTTQQDWYNWINTKPFDPANIKPNDGVDGPADDATYVAELNMAKPGWWDGPTDSYKPRTMAGIDVKWSIFDIPDNPATAINEAVVSVGNITKVGSTAITAAKSATGKTDADGLSCITIESTKTGMTYTQAVATYPGNPYPNLLFNHATFDYDWVEWVSHAIDWDEQPTAHAMQKKTWISHTLPPQGGPISPAYSALNIGEEKVLTLTLVDVYGNPKSGVEVEWFMQGVGFFKTDDKGDSSDPLVAANNKDFDVTDKDGKATLLVKSFNSGEQIIHAKVRDKGTGGSEGPFQTYTAEVQWFDVDVATFDDPTTHTEYKVWDPNANKGKGGYVTVWNNEALSKNPVGQDHKFCLWVYGLKWEYAPTIDYPDGQTRWIDGDTPGYAYDGIIDAKDAEYFGGILLYGGPEVTATDKPGDYPFSEKGHWAEDLNGNGIIEPWVKYYKGGDLETEHWADERGTIKVLVAGRWLTLSMEGAFTEYDWDDDGYKEDFEGLSGIYLPLEDKTVTFKQANQHKSGESHLGEYFYPHKDANDKVIGVKSVGSHTPNKAVTDADGKACVTVSSDDKGPKTVEATVDWAGNPHNGPELLKAYAKKLWVAGTIAPATDLTIEVLIDGVLVANNKDGEIVGDLPNKVIRYYDEELDEWVLNWAYVEVHVKDQFGNDLADYEVVYLLEQIGYKLEGSQGAVDTYIPLAYLDDKWEEDDDMNYGRPDHDEPRPWSDPYAYIVGKGGTRAFFFNQWLGSEKPTYEGQGGVPKWWQRVPGWGFGDYLMEAEDLAELLYDNGEEIFDGVDGVLGDGEPGEDDDVGLATDGAKAWTLDGYRKDKRTGDGEVDPEHGGNIVPNKLTGSNIWIRLAEDPFDRFEGLKHAKSILQVMVYAPADGLVVDSTPIWTTQVHKVWTEDYPAPKSIVLEQRDPEASGPTDPNWWNKAYDTPMELPGGLVLGDLEGEIDLRGMVRDAWGRPLYEQEYVPQVDPDGPGGPLPLRDFKVMAWGNIANIFWADVEVISGTDFWADVQGWIGDMTTVHSFQTGNFATYTGMPKTTVTFQAWLDADNDNLIDANELQSNKVRTTFILGILPVP